MRARRIAFSAALNAASAGAGLAGTTLIVWHFGLATFGIYTIALAKLSILMLGTELLPSSYIQFRIQDDPRFAESCPVFYLLFATTAVMIATLLIWTGAIAGSSWFVLPYVFCSALQSGFDSQILARGKVGLSVSVPLVANCVRAALLYLLVIFPALTVTDTLWGSLFGGIFVSQCFMVARYPEFARALFIAHPVSSLRYLFSLRAQYVGYYVNSVLKRTKDTLFPLVCDALLPSKTELGQVLVYTRAMSAVAGQIRVLELFLIHRETRANLAKQRRRILLASASLGHIGVVVMSAVLLWKHGLTVSSTLNAAAMGLFMYPYVYELAKRSDAYASLNPGRVTFSLIAYILALALSLAAAAALHVFVTPVLIGCMVLAQSASAIVYYGRTKRGAALMRKALPRSRTVDAPLFGNE